MVHPGCCCLSRPDIVLPPKVVTQSSLQAFHVEGEPGTLSYALYFTNGVTGEKLSPWHDIPLRPVGAAYGTYRFVCEIPKG